MSAQPIVKCPVCGTEAPRRFYSGECSGECFTKGYWLDLVRCSETDICNTSPVARIGGKHYTAAPFKANERPEFLGCGGAVHTIRWTAGPHVGKVMKTNNLWVQGFIPAEFREQLPDNAEFVKEATA